MTILHVADFLVPTFAKKPGQHVKMLAVLFSAQAAPTRPGYMDSYAGARLGIGPEEWVALHGTILPRDMAQVFIPDLDAILNLAGLDFAYRT